MYKHDHSRIPEGQGSLKLGQRDVEKEYDQYECTVKGKMPTWLNGTVYKQAGGAFEPDINFLDGLAHLVSFKLQDGQALFTNKYLRTKDYQRFVNKGKRTWASTATNSTETSCLSRLVESVVGSGNVVPAKEIKYSGANPNVNVWAFEQGKILGAATEATGLVCAFNSTTLETEPSIKTMSSKGALSMILTNPAHYFYDHEETGGGYHVALELRPNLCAGLQPRFSFCYTIFHGDTAPFAPVYTMDIASFGYSQRAQQEATKRAAYQHTVATTKNYFIMMLPSVRLRYERLLTNDSSGGFFSFFDLTEVPVEFIVFRIDAITNGLELVDSFESEFCGMVWHTSNAYEDENGMIVVDITTAEEFSEDAPTSLQRFTIDLEAKRVNQRMLRKATSEHQVDFPNVNSQFLKQSYRYTYLLSNELKPTSGLIKCDVESGDADDKVLFEEEDIIPSEPVFVPAPGSNAEDDGVVLSITINTKEETSQLQIIDAKDFEVVATVSCPMVCNVGLHTLFVPADGFQHCQKL